MIREPDRARAAPTPGGLASRTDRSSDLTDITFGIVTYNGRRHLPATLGRLRELFGDRATTLLVDDGSDDGTRAWVREHHPQVAVHPMGRHVGRMNVLRNRVLEESKTRFVFLMDDDILLTQECPAELLRLMRGSDSILCCTPRLLNAGDPNTVYSDGSGLHYLCLSARPQRGRAVSDLPPGDPCPTVGGGIMLVNRARAAEIGGFDEGFELGWGDDGEFHIRGQLRGLKCLHVSTAVCLHVEKQHGTRRAPGQLYNRYRTILTVYSRRALILLTPPLLTVEVALTALGLTRGFLGQRFAAVAQVWKQRGEIKKLRRRIQSTRRLSDGKILEGGPIGYPVALRDSRTVRVGVSFLERFVDGYYALISRWL